MGHILLINPLSGRGHLDAYARLYARALLELGHRVTLVADTDAGAPDYLARHIEATAQRFAFVSIGEGTARLTARSPVFPATRGDASAAAQNLLQRVVRVWCAEGPAGILDRLLRRVRRAASWVLKHVIPVGPARISFAPLIAAARGAMMARDSEPPDLACILYLDLMAERSADVAGLDAPDAWPWTGILFHPRLAADPTAAIEGYFASRRARGAIFLVPGPIPAYQRARPDLHFALVPDLADLETAAAPHPVAAEIRRRAGGRTVVLQIGTLAPHKGILTLLEVIAHADPARFFFALVGEVLWESFGADEHRLRSFHAAPPENVLVHDGYIPNERAYNSVLAACDVIYAVYPGFNSSSNSLAKAAGLERRILVAQGTLMGERVLASRIGAVAPEGDPAAILAALASVADRPADDFDFAHYAAQHSLAALKAVLAEAVPRWCGPATPQVTPAAATAVAPVRIHFCTLFDSRYATRGLTMLDSLAEHARDAFDVTILAMDNVVPDLVARLGRPNWRVVQVSDLGDADFTALEKTRPHREFCWTAASVLCKRMIDVTMDGDFVVYLDSDLLFFDDPRILLDELGEHGTILIHEHRYSPDRAHYEKSSGRFNVGFVAFRVGDEARRCAGRWRDQVIDRCELDPDNGYCGDQGYLNEWPDLYPGLRIMQNIGGGAAPWNLNGYSASGRRRRPVIDGVPLVFFHYHSFRAVEVGQFGQIAAQPAYGYTFTRRCNRLFFKDYARRLRVAAARVRRAGFAVAGDEMIDVRAALRGVLAGRYVLALAI